MPPNLCTLGEAWNAVDTTTRTVVTIVMRKIMELAECWAKNEERQSEGHKKTKNYTQHSRLCWVCRKCLSQTKVGTKGVGRCLLHRTIVQFHE